MPTIATPLFTGGWYTYDDGSIATPDGGAADGPPPGKEVVIEGTLDQPHVSTDPNPNRGAK